MDQPANTYEDHQFVLGACSHMAVCATPFLESPQPAGIPVLSEFIWHRAHATR